jgi:hypothetical protein
MSEAELPEPVRTMATRTAYRSLMLRGLSPAEAANLTAFIAGLGGAGHRPWRLTEINRILFLRELHRSGRTPGSTGGPAGDN